MDTLVDSLLEILLQFIKSNFSIEQKTILKNLLVKIKDRLKENSKKENFVELQLFKLLAILGIV